MNTHAKVRLNIEESDEEVEEEEEVEQNEMHGNLSFRFSINPLIFLQKIALFRRRYGTRSVSQTAENVGVQYGHEKTTDSPCFGFFHFLTNE